MFLGAGVVDSQNQELGQQTQKTTKHKAPGLRLGLLSE
jgi:hypothetical protein